MLIHLKHLLHFKDRRVQLCVLLTVNTSLKVEVTHDVRAQVPRVPFHESGHAFCWEVEHYDHYFLEAAAGWVFLAL